MLDPPQLMAACQGREISSRTTTAESSSLSRRRAVRWSASPHLSEVFLRRTSLAFTGAVSVPLVREIAEIAENALGCSPKRRTEEEDTFQSELADAHRVRLASGDGGEAVAFR